MKNYLFALFIFTSLTNSTKLSSQNPNNMLKKFAEYNLWANTQLVNWMKGATVQQFNQEVESSFSSLKKTTAHIWSAEYGWLQYLQESDWVNPVKDFEIYQMTDFLDKFLEHSALMTHYVLSLDDEGFAKTYMSDNGAVTSAQDIILHVFNHSTFHRGQIITIARQVGLQNFPRTDFIYYSKTEVKK